MRLPAAEGWRFADSAGIMGTNMLRVISGRYKGKRLKRVPDLKTRPIPDKLKEALFNIIQDRIRGKLILDGFSGTGSFGIEALSRGARAVVFVDDFLQAVGVIRANLERCGIEDGARVLAKEFNRAVIQLAAEDIRFDLIFLDPPYRMLDERNPLKVIKKRDILSPGGTIILRHHFKTRFDGKYFREARRVHIGDDVIVFYREKSE